VTEDRHAHRGPCGGHKAILAIVLTLFYALPRYAIDCLRGNP
jgi:hypothetical protein